TDTEIIHWLRQQVISLENPLTRLNDKPYGRSFVARLKCSSNPGDQICWSDPIDPKEHITSDNINWQDLEVLLDEIRPVLANVLIRADQLTARFGPLFALSSDGVEDDQDYKEYKLQIKYAVLELESLGKLLYKKIIGGKFEEITKEFKPGHPLQFYTDKHLAWIPWELIYDEKQKAFWGELYPIGRPAYPLTDTHTHRIDSNGNNQSDHQVINIAGDQLVKHGLPELITQLQKAFKGMKVKGNVEMPLVFMPVTDVREKIDDCDIVHLTCHGDKNKRGVYYLRLGPEEIYQLKLHHICSFNFKPQSLIFTNACTTISGALLFNEYSNFGWEIYQRNADTYLGTIGPVPSGEAIVFAETFYGYLIRDKLPAGIALWKAKQTFSKRKPCTPFYLLYCLYGNPKWCW
ncbi:MAG: CHAT domain-containing protein, partial [Desulfobacteraceae bacterium]|nr:CHAT domain-containing protein [Desulfobacteraceae bacterium]